MHMSGFEHTSESETAPPIFPQVNSYVVFSIDPWASLASGNQIKNISEELLAISNRKYAALVSEILEVFYVDAQSYHLWQFEYLRKGSCPQHSTEAQLIEPSTSLPVEPATDNPTHWKPLSPCKPLPWAHCFHYSFYGWTEVRCRNRNHSNDTPQYHMNAEEKSRMTHMRRLSIQLEETARKNRNISRIENAQYPKDPEIPVEAINQYLDGNFRVVVDCSYDLDSVEEFDDPFLFFDDANYLACLKSEMKGRDMSSAGTSTSKISDDEVRSKKAVHSIVHRVQHRLAHTRSATRRILASLLLR